MSGKKIIVGCCVVGAALLFAGACNPWERDTGAVLVEEVYTVKPGDTLWGISEAYLAKNTGTRRYILEYKEGLYELNPWLVERRGEIYPGDEIRVTYWIKEDKQ